MDQKKDSVLNTKLLKFVTILPIVVYIVLWIGGLLVLAHLKEHPFLWFFEIIKEIKGEKGWMTGLILLMFMGGGVIVKVFWSAVKAFLKALFSILFYPISIPLLWIGKFFSKDRRVPRFEAWACYKAFLMRYYQQGSYSGILDTHRRFLPFMLYREFPKKWKYRSWLMCPFETGSKLVEIQNIIDNREEGDEKMLLVRDFEMDDHIITFSLFGGSKSGKEMKAHMKSVFGSIQQKLPWFDSKVRYQMEEYANDEDIKSDHIEVVIKRKVEWESRKFDFANASKKLADWNLLLGFASEGGSFEDLQIPLQSVLHSMIVAETWKGKDVTTRSFLWSVLEGIRKWLPFELHLFDSKWDWLPFRDMKDYGVYLYEDTSKYTSIVSNLVDEMRERNKEIGMEADLGAYLKSHKDSDLKFRFIFINEFSSLYGLLEKKDQKALHSNLNILFSQSRSAGYRISMILQTARSQSDNTIRDLSLNIGTTIAGTIKDEIEAGMISQRFKKRIANLETHNFCLIQNGECAEFRSYSSEKPDIARWLSETFVPDMEQKTANLNKEASETALAELIENPAVKEFLEYARSSWRLSKEEALARQSFGETTFRKLAVALLWTGEIRFETGKWYSFVEQEFGGKSDSEI